MIAPLRLLVVASAATMWLAPPSGQQSLGQEQPTPRNDAGKDGGESEEIDFDKARQLLHKRQRGERLTDAEAAYLERARERGASSGNAPPAGRAARGRSD